MRIAKLYIENFQRIKIVEIIPDDNFVVIGGDNAQGKSTALDAIVTSLGGKGMQSDRPVHEGAKKAVIQCDIKADEGEVLPDDLKDGLIITCEIKPDGKRSLSVKKPDGSDFKKPQTVIDRIKNNLGFDPLEFFNMTTAEHIEELKKIAGIDFSELDKSRAAAYDLRTLVNRDIKIKEAKLAGMPEYPYAPLGEVKVSDLLEKLEWCRAQNRENRDKRFTFNELKNRITSQNDNINEIKVEIDRLRKNLIYEQDNLLKLISNEETLSKEIASLVDQDESAILNQINNAEDLNYKVKANNDRQEVQGELEPLKTQAEELTNQINDIDAEKEKKLAEAELPVPGLSFDENGVTYNGLPFSMASTAEKIAISGAIGIKKSPILNIILTRQGSALDNKHFNELKKNAIAANVQWWIECVGSGRENEIIIEDGEVAR